MPADILLRCRGFKTAVDHRVELAGQVTGPSVDSSDSCPNRLWAISSGRPWASAVLSKSRRFVEKRICRLRRLRSVGAFFRGKPRGGPKKNGFFFFFFCCFHGSTVDRGASGACARAVASKQPCVGEPASEQGKVLTAGLAKRGILRAARFSIDYALMDARHEVAVCGQLCRLERIGSGGG